MKQRLKEQYKESTKRRAALWIIKQDLQTFSETDKRKERRKKKQIHKTDKMGGYSKHQWNTEDQKVVFEKRIFKTIGKSRKKKGQIPECILSIKITSRVYK